MMKFVYILRDESKHTHIHYLRADRQLAGRTQRQLDRHKETVRQTHIDNQTKNRDSQTDTHTVIQTHRETDTETVRKTERQTDTETVKLTHGQSGRHTETVRQTQGQSERHTETDRHRDSDIHAETVRQTQRQ